MFVELNANHMNGEQGTTVWSSENSFDGMREEAPCPGSALTFSISSVSKDMSYQPI
jgi:hypothetical protein